MSTQDHTRPTARARPLRDGAVTGFFLILLFLPVLDLLIQIDPTRGVVEKRELARLPEVGLDAQKIREFPRQFEAYFNDHFGFRDLLLRTNALARVFLFRKTSSNVLVGKEDWLFFGADAAVDSYRAADPFSDAELREWHRLLRKREEWLEQQGIRSLFFVAPNKHSIYPEFLPDDLERVGSVTRLDQLHDELRRQGDVEFLDVRPTLLEAKQTDQVYFRTDTHWNAIGALYVTRELTRYLSRDFPALLPPKLADYRIEEVVVPTTDLTQMIGLDNVMQETSPELTPLVGPPAQRAALEPELVRPVTPPGAEGYVAWETGRPELPSAVMFRDSFASLLVPFLSQHFSRIVYVWSRNFDPVLVRHEQPDVVITEMVERLLMQPIILDPPEIDAAENRDRFEASSELLSVSDTQNGFAGLTASAQAKLALDGEGLTIQATGSAPELKLPDLPRDLARPALIRIELTVPEDTHLTLRYTVGEGQAQLRFQRLLQGPNISYLELPANTHADSLSLFPGQCAGSFRLRSIEIRSLGDQS